MSRLTKNGEEALDLEPVLDIEQRHPLALRLGIDDDPERLGSDCHRRHLGFGGSPKRREGEARSSRLPDPVPELAGLLAKTGTACHQLIICTCFYYIIPRCWR
jgi:hypothetical protein